MKKEPEAEGALLDLVERNGTVTLRVRVKPRASREGILGVLGGALVVRLTAAPVEGAANQALRHFLGKRLGVPPSAVAIATGSQSRNKLVVVSGLGAKEALARLEEAGSRAARS